MPNPTTLGSATDASVNHTHLQVCPKCKTVYKEEHPPYCAYDANLLISADDLSPKSSSAHPVARLTLWVLVSITMVGSAYLTFLFTNRLIKEKESSAPVATQGEQPANEKAKKDPPIVGGALRGAEINLPEPEYAARLKSEGISGTVTVLVLVNKKGRVISTRALDGDPRLQAAAIAAAKRATFSPGKLAGRDSGSITYIFKL